MRIRGFRLLPVLGYFFVRGRCASCRVRLSPQYPIVEASVALIWAAMVARWGMHPEALRGSVFLTILLGIAVTDARTYIIPDQFSLGGAVVGVAFAFLAGGPTAADGIVGATLGFGLLWAVAAAAKSLLGKDALGGGDVKMMAMVGAFLGPVGVLVTLFVGSLLGALVFGPIAVRTGRPVPFGVFLAAGAGISYAWGDVIVSWYAGAMLGAG